MKFPTIFSISYGMAVIYFHKIHVAVGAGLQENCMQLARDWPSDGDRIYSSDPVYKQLPDGIKFLKPGYVLREKSESTNSLPSIGICTDGFGGFAVGVRVFGMTMMQRNL